MCQIMFNAFGPPIQPGEAQSDVKVELNQLWLGNLRHNIDEETVREYIASLGHFDDFTVRLGPPRGQLKDAFCFVEFTQMSHVLALKAFLNGREVSIRKCMPHRYSQCKNIWTSLKINRHQPKADYIAWHMTPILQTWIAESRSHNENKWTPMQGSMH